MSTRFGNPSMVTGAAAASGPASTAHALVVAAAPVVLLGALLWHPLLPGRLPDSAMGCQ